MQLKLRLQLNGQFLSSAKHSSYPETKNVTFVNKLIPISWSETEATIDQESAEEYSSQVNKLGGQENLLSLSGGSGIHCLRPAKTVRTLTAPAVNLLSLFALVTQYYVMYPKSVCRGRNH